MKDSTNLAKLKAAYRAWHDTKGENTDAWLDLFDEDVCLRSMSADGAGLDFAIECHNRMQTADYFKALLDGWEMEHWKPDAYVEDGDRIAMFGHCAWRSRTTGKSTNCAIAHLWTFKDGKVIEIREVFDSADVVAAATPD